MIVFIENPLDKAKAEAEQLALSAHRPYAVILGVDETWKPALA